MAPIPDSRLGRSRNITSRERPADAAELGQAAVLLLGVMAALVLGALVLGAFGQALGTKGRHQRAADLAAMSAALAMRDAYPRLFEAPEIRPGVQNPRHLSQAEYEGLARSAAVRGARRNGATIRPADVTFPSAGAGAVFAPTRVAVAVRGSAEVRLGSGGRRRREAIEVRARAVAEIAPSSAAAFDLPTHGSGGGYDGPLAYRMGKPMRPDVALAFDRMAAAARREAGLHLSINSAFRSDAEQARLFAANPNPHLFSAL